MTDQPGVTDVVARFVAEADLGPIAGAVDAVVAGVLLDTVGVSLAGERSGAAEAVRRFTGVRSSFPVPADATGVRRANAALLGGTTAHSLDFDDYAHMGHASAVLIPALLAMDGAVAEPRAFADAYAVGFEVWERIARWAQAHYASGFHTTATVGTIGAACAVSRLLGADAREVAGAIGLAGSLAGGLLAAFGTDLKPVQAGLAASAGVQAALLVRAGLAGPLDSLDLPVGFLGAYLGPGSAADAAKTLLELGELAADPSTAAVLIRPPAAKPYPCCAATHGAIEAALRLRGQAGLGPGVLPEAIIVTTPTVNYADALRYHDPATPLEAKFCMEYCVAASLAGGEVGLAQFTGEALGDDHVRGLLRLVRIETDAALNELFWTGKVPARVEVIIRGQSFTVEVDDPVGGQTKPMRLADIRAKFRRTAAGHLGGEQIETIDAASGSLGELLLAIRAVAESRADQNA